MLQVSDKTHPGPEYRADKLQKRNPTELIRAGEMRPNEGVRGERTCSRSHTRCCSTTCLHVSLHSHGKVMRQEQEGCRHDEEHHRLWSDIYSKK